MTFLMDQANYKSREQMLIKRPHRQEMHNASYQQFVKTSNIESVND